MKNNSSKASGVAVANSAYIEAMRELRKGSRTSRHTLKKHKGTRSAAKRSAIRETY